MEFAAALNRIADPIALPYHRATVADLDDVDAAVGELRAASVPKGDDVFAEL